MAANFIFEGPGKLRTTMFQAAAQYDVGELNFYVAANMGSKLQVFMILKNENGLYEIVELTKAGVSGQNILYKLPINQKLRVGNERVSLELLVIDPATGLYHLSGSTHVHVKTDNYMLARQVYIAQEVGAAVQNCYARTLALVEEFEKQHKQD